MKVLYVLSIFIMLSVSLYGLTNAQEREFLKSFYLSTDGDNWKNTLNNDKVWKINTLNSNYCSWYGITCNSNGHIKWIKLKNNKLHGDIPSSLGDITDLQFIDMLQPIYQNMK